MTLMAEATFNLGALTVVEQRHCGFGKGNEQGKYLDNQEKLAIYEHLPRNVSSLLRMFFFASSC